MGKRKAKSAVPSKPYWTIYARVLRDLQRQAGAPGMPPDYARLVAMSIEAMAHAHIVYLPWELAESLPPAAPTYKEEAQELRHVRPPFGVTFLAFGGQFPDMEAGWSDSPLYAALVLEEGEKAIAQPFFLPVDELSRDVYVRTGRHADRIEARGFGFVDGDGDGIRVRVASEVADRFAQIEGGAGFSSQLDELSEQIVGGTQTALRSLYLLEAANVGLDPRPMAFKGHKAAGRPSYEVVVRTKSSKSIPRGGTVEWSHRWWTRGHWKHHGLTSPIFRNVERTNPSKVLDHPERGRCVRIWCPPHIKGPASEPLVEKALVRTA